LHLTATQKELSLFSSLLGPLQNPQKITIRLYKQFIEFKTQQGLSESLRIVTIYADVKMKTLGSG